MNAAIDQKLRSVGGDARVFAKVFRFSPLLRPPGVQHRFAGVGKVSGMGLQMFPPDLLTRLKMSEVHQHGRTHAAVERHAIDGFTSLKEMKGRIHVCTYMNDKP